jgi:hypothetical protein
MTPYLSIGLRFGEMQIWHMNGQRITVRATVRGEDGRPVFVRLPWAIVGTDYFDLDKTIDILWHNDSSGETQIWFMIGS